MNCPAKVVKTRIPMLLIALLVLFLGMAGLCAAETLPVAGAADAQFPPSLESYGDSHLAGLCDVIHHRIQQQPLNLWATLLFCCALVHTFFTHKFRHWAHVIELRSEPGGLPGTVPGGRPPRSPMPARLLHFFGEVEVVFGIWCVPLAALLSLRAGWRTTLDYLDHRVSYHEALFVVVVMSLASTRPIVQLAERCLKWLAGMGGGGPAAWWWAILTVGPMLGSLITEPAAMTISALLLAKQFYARKPPAPFAYATLGLLFVNVSVGGVLTHFAAPAVLMVAGPWGWNTPFMAGHFGWVALLGIVIANTAYYLCFRKDFLRLAPAVPALAAGEAPGVKEQPVPLWITAVHAGFIAWSVWNAHHPSLLIGGFLFFLAFHAVTVDCQGALQLRSPILVGFFLAGLVIHGGLQQWWLEPIMRRLTEVPLMFGAIGLTAFNDNAAITYLAALVPGLSDGMKYAVVAGAVTGGGLTVIANAPNPAGQSLLNRFFPDGISPMGLLFGALPATVILALCFLFLR